MYKNRRNVLAIGVTSGEFDRVAPFLNRDSFEVDRFPGPLGALELTAEVAFEVLLVRFPLPKMELKEFLSALRNSGGKSERSSVILLSADESVDEAKKFIGRGANRAMQLEEADEKIQKAISDLLNVAPRKDARFMARLEIKIGGTRDMVICQTENLSASGMLVKTDRKYDKGTRFDFEFNIPQDQRPIVGTAEVMRHTLERDKVIGAGVRFVAFSGDSQRRFKAYIDSL